MRKPRRVSALQLRTASLCCLLLFSGFACQSALAQEPSDLHNERARGIQFYKTGYFANAIAALNAVVEKRKEDVEAWYYLGLAHKSGGSGCDAILAFDRAIALRPKHAEAHSNLALVLVLGSDVKRSGLMAQRAIELGVKTAEVHYVLAESAVENKNYEEALQEANRALVIDPKLGDALLTKAVALHGLKREPEAIDALSKYLKTNADADDLASWRQTLAWWQEELQTPKKSDDAPKTSDDTAKPTVYRPVEVTAKARILSKPTPQYTEKARRACITGTVVIQLVLSSNGEVTNIRTVSGLRGGLTHEAIKAARGIKFEPAVKDGSPVSQYIRVEYNFNMY